MAWVDDVTSVTKDVGTLIGQGVDAWQTIMGGGGDTPETVQSNPPAPAPTTTSPNPELGGGVTTNQLLMIGGAVLVAVLLFK